MDKQELQNTIAKYYQKLPARSQKLFAEMKWLEDLKQISAHYNLNQAQIEVLGTETTLVLLGIISLTDYEGILMRELGLARNKADELIAEIDERILRNIRGELDNSYNQNLVDTANENDIAPENIETSENQNQETKINVKVEEKGGEVSADLASGVENAIKQSNYQDTLYKIADENDLSIEQMGLLEDAINESFAGKISSSDFGPIVKKRLNLPEEKVNLLVNQINEKILKDVRKKLMQESSGLGMSDSFTEINQDDKDIMKNAGFEIEADAKNKMREFKREDYKESYMKDAGIKVEKEKEIETKKEMPENKEEVLGLAGIKIVNNPNPTPMQTKKILENKLSSDSVSQSTETDHSAKDLSKILNSNTKNQTDPYRMPIE